MAERPGAVLLDTHVWVWVNAGDRRNLSRGVVRTIERAAARGAVLVAAISLWEVAMLESKRRLRLSMPIATWLDRALHAPGVRLVPLSTDIAVESASLISDLGDPADSMIVATARAESATLITRDVRLVRYGESGVVRVIDASN